MSRLRILHVVFSSRLAGSERYCIDLASRQAEEGHDVHVAGMRGTPIPTALDPRVTFHGFATRFFRRFLLRRLAVKLGADVCHGHLSADCKALGRMSDVCATVATLHVGYKAHQHAELDGLICVNRTQVGRLAGYHGLVRTIPNWMPQPSMETSSTGIRKELGLGEDVFLVGAVGRLHPSKGMDVLISAFRASAPARAALVILGDGPQRAALEILRANDPRIHLLGYRPVVHSCLRDLDLFVSPSREESFGLAIIEAMSTGARIIATATEGPGGFLLDHPVALVPPDSVEALAYEIRAAHEQYCTVGLPRIGYDLSLFDPAPRLANIMDFYGQVLLAGQRSPARQKVPGMAVAT